LITATTGPRTRKLYYLEQLAKIAGGTDQAARVQR
jgi:hypothetical protein